MGVWCLPPYSRWTRVPELGLCGLASQTIFCRTVWSSGKGCRALPRPLCPPHSWVSAEVVLNSRTGSWKQGLSSWAFWDSSGFFCFVFICFVFAGIDYFFRLQFLVSGAPLCGHYPQGYECWGEVSPEHEGWLGGLSRKNLS